MNTQQQWYSYGKLLISGEYLVMEGAKSFALPLKQGQKLLLKSSNDSYRLTWTASQGDGNWFKAVFETEKFEVVQSDNQKLAENLSRILLAVRQLSKSFLRGKTAFAVETKLDFNPEFGFGSSSTLISNLAWWAEVDPYELLKLTFGGSGYDIACARVNSPIFYRLTANGPKIEKVIFKPGFRNQLYFVYLGNKQKSTESIQSFKKQAVFGKDDLNAISLISEKIATAKLLQEFEDLLNGHEKRMATILKRPTVKSLLFSDYKGSVKSLGGWGGDFVLLTTNQSNSDFRADMKERGFPVVFGFDELVL
jgi:mevalonate kinase